MTVVEILALIDKLSFVEQEKIKSTLFNAIPGNTGLSKTTAEFVTEERFANGMVCPLCGCINVVRNGHRADGTQRFICRDCKKSFVAASNSIVSGTRKDFSVWEKYVSCMMNGMSIRKTTEICGIHRNTAFYWRHKILEALQDMVNDMELEGIVEADETFFSISYEGNHKNSKVFVMPREAHKRGGEPHVRGLSSHKVCVPCTVNRKGLSIAKISNLGRVSAKNLSSVFDGHISPDATLVTDKMNSYVRFADKNNIKLVQLKNGRDKNGIYNIQHINSYHSLLKKFMRNFNGVSTKYLNNYLVWHNFVNYARETESKKRNILMRFCLTAIKKIACRDISDRQPIPVLM